MSEDHARHTGRDRAFAVDLNSVADHEHVGGIGLPTATGGEKSFRVRLEGHHLRISRADRESKPSAEAEGLDLLSRGVVGKDAGRNLVPIEKVQKFDDAFRATP